MIFLHDGESSNLASGDKSGRKERWERERRRSMLELGVRAISVKRRQRQERSR